VLLLVAVLLSAYFLSQSGFVNYVTDGGIHSATLDFYRMKASNNPQIEIQFYVAYIPNQDALSSVWLSSEDVNASSFVYADTLSMDHVLSSCALIPSNRLLPLSNTAIQGQSFIYLSSLNVVDGIISNGTGFFNSSEIQGFQNISNQVYSNGNSDIWQVNSFG
jgi:hypothetical protein